MNLNENDLLKIEKIISGKKRIKRGGFVYHNGDLFKALYGIRTGFFKSCITSQDGRSQVTGFHMSGEVIGLDGVFNNHYTCSAIALEDAEVCILDFEKLESISLEIPSLQMYLHKIMSREIIREHGIMLLLGHMRAEERLASFILNLSQRLHIRGFSETELILRMTREEIGSYLGLKLETVSRTFSNFTETKLLEVNQKYIKILNINALRDLVHYNTLV